MSDFKWRVWHLLRITSVNPTTEVLEERLEEWPSHLNADKELLRTSTCDAIAAESSENCKRASQHYSSCLKILIANKTAIPQELLLWLAKRICVPLAFINQFRLKNFKLAYETLKFMFNYVHYDYDYGDRELTWIEVRLKKFVEVLMMAVLYDAKDDAEDVDFEYHNWLSTGDVQGLKAFCCENLCVQYYRLGKIEDVWWWLDEWKRSLTCITADENLRRLQYQECCIAEASLLLEHGEVQQAQEIMLNLAHQYAEDENLRYSLPDLSRAIFLRLGDADNADLELLKMITFEENLETEDLEEFRRELLVLRGQADEAKSSGREEDAIRDMQRCIDIKKNSSCYRDDPSLPGSVCRYLSDIAVCHIRLFLQKELKFFIDTRDSLSYDENYTAYRSMSLKVCTHHCWSPYCLGGRHCTEEDESHFESPTHFFTKRRIESDGNNLHHLEDAVTSLVEALDLADELVKSTGESVLVAEVHSLLARTYLLIAQNKYCPPIMLPILSKSEPLIRGITPEVLVASECRTIQQVRECLKLKGISPEVSFQLSHYHIRQCAQMFTKLLDSNRNYIELWIPMIEKHKDVYFRLQFTLFCILEYYVRIRDMLQGALRITGEDVSSCVEEFKKIVFDIAPEILLWSERGRARFLELQLMRRKQPEIIHAMEPNRDDLATFALRDEVAWDVIRSSLDACGEDTVFLEYSFNERSEYLNSFHLSTFRFGTVYAVKKGRGMVIEPQSLAVLNGQPEMVIGVIQSLHEALISPEYIEADVIRALEVLYQLLIFPVAEFLKQMQYEHKLVICPNDIFTKVPFAILRNPAEKSLSKGYLFQNHTISITPSLRVLKHNKERYSTLQKMELMEGQGASVVIGDPTYKNPKMRLEHSSEEVEFIASLFPNRCAQVKGWDATVETLLDWAKLPSERSRSQAFVHIAAHCETGDDYRRHGILRLTELDSQPCSSSSAEPDLIRPDGTLSAESIVKSEIEWRARMIVLSACSSGEGEIKAEGVLNLPRAFMVAGVPCSVVSQWPVEDGSTAQLMKFLYQKLLEGMDVATALQSSMQQMLDDGFNIKQWGAFMVWGLPTICLPDELLSKDAGAAFLQIGKELLESKRYSDALLPLKKSLEMMKANKDHTNNDALVQCLCWLAGCEEYFCSRDPNTFYLQNSAHLRFASRFRDDDFGADQFSHLDAAIQYLGEALKHAKVDGSVPPTQLDIHLRLGYIYNLRAGCCWLRWNVIPLPNMIDGIPAVLDTFQANDVSAVDSWRKAIEHYMEYAKLCSQNMNRLTLGSEHWVSAATSRNKVLLDMQNILCFNRIYLHYLKQHLIERHHKLTGDAAMETVRYTLEHRFLVSKILVKAMWLNRMYIPPWELSLGWRTIDDYATWDLLLTDSLKETCKLARCCGDVVVEYYALDDDPSSQKFLLICVMSQVRPPHYFLYENQDVLNNLDLVLTRTASMMSAHSNLKSHILLKDLEYLYEVLIKPIREYALKTLHEEQKLVFVPCECLAAVPFGLLRDGAQPHGDGYLIQSHTISVMPSFRMLEYCSQRLQDLQTLPFVPDSSASLFLSNPCNFNENEDVGPAAVVASLFPTRCSVLHGSDATIESLVDWAELPSLTNMHCQAFFHIEAEIEEDSGMGVLKLANFQACWCSTHLARRAPCRYDNIEESCSSISEAGSGSRSKDGRLSSEAIVKYGFQWRVRMAVLRACESANGQIHKEGVLSVTRAFLAVGVPCVVTSDCPVDDAFSSNFFAHFYTSMKDGDDVATAVRYSMLQMKKDGFHLNQWGAFSVFGAPNVHLPQEMLRSCEELLQNGRNLLDSHRYFEALLIFKKSLNMLKAKDDDSIMKSFHVLRWLGECEEGLFKFKHIQSLGLKYPSIEFDYRMFTSPHQREALEPDQLIHLQSAIHYLVEALKVAQDIKKDVLPIDQSIEKQLGLLHFLEGLCHYRRFESQILTGNIGTRDSMQEMLIFLQKDAGLKCQDSWHTSAECFIQHLNTCSSVRDREMRYCEPWLMAVDSQIKTTDLMLHVTQWEREYFNTVYRYLLTTHRLTGRVCRTEAILTKEFQSLTLPLILREYRLERKSRVRWEIPIERQSTRTFSGTDVSIEIGKTCGEDPVILEYSLDLEVTNTITTLITLELQEPVPVLHSRCVPIEEPQKLKRVLATLCPSMADKTKFNISESLKDLEYMYMLLIGNNETVESTLRRMSLNQKLIIVPGKLLSVVPFALLRNPDQPQGKGYLFQSNTISIQPSLRILEHCCQRFESMQSRCMMQGSKASLVIGCSTSTEENERCKRINEEESVASQFPDHCVDMRGLASTHVESLLDWAELPSSSKRDCQAFVHIKALAVFDEEIQQEVLKLAGSTMELSPKIVNLQNTNGYTKPILQSFEGTKAAESSGTESINREDQEFYEALENAKRLSLGVGEVKDDICCTSSRHGSLSAEAIAKSPFEWWVRMVALSACEAPKSQVQAESVLNLARAFMVAGVPCVIMSHWLPSDTAATSVLFGQLYRLMKEGDDVSTALRRSMLRMLEDGVGMEQWGAYSVLGLPTVCLPDDMLVHKSGKEKITD